MLIVILTCGLASTAFAGPIILGGDDLDYHGNYNSGSGPNQKASKGRSPVCTVQVVSHAPEMPSEIQIWEIQ